MNPQRGTDGALPYIRGFHGRDGKRAGRGREGDEGEWKVEKRD